MELCCSGGQWTAETIAVFVIMADLCRVRRIGCSMIFDALADHHITCDVQFSVLDYTLFNRLFSFFLST